MYGIEAAIERAHRFVEADTDNQRLRALFETPDLINIVIGGKTPTLVGRVFIDAENPSHWKA